ncbi:hypothetical protein XENORESO_010047, partial [Xenotaenia resolanae]
IMKTMYGVLLLMLLSVAWLSQAEKLYVVDSMEPKDCTAKMNEMVNKGQKDCSKSNTFIVAKKETLDKFCKGRSGKYSDKITIKNVHCEHKKESKYPDCEYKGHTHSDFYLECGNNKAVGFQHKIN